MGIRIYQVDAFSEKAFAGNPAAVCLLSGPREEEWMQHVAREMNLSETAFPYRREDGFSLRWFTPAAEVDLCGHATLATAHTLWEAGLLEPGERARFHTLSGWLTCELRGDIIEMDFPSHPEEPAPAPAELMAALGVKPRYVGRFKEQYIIEADTEEAVRDLDPDFHALKALPERGVMVTSAATSPGFDFVSRYFAPWVGVDEDPVTGSAHCCLGPFWSKRLGKKELTAYQASARGGIVHVRVEEGRVRIGGRAVTVLSGELLV